MQDKQYKDLNTLQGQSIPEIMNNMIADIERAVIANTVSNGLKSCWDATVSIFKKQSTAPTLDPEKEKIINEFNNSLAGFIKNMTIGGNDSNASDDDSHEKIKQWLLNSLNEENNAAFNWIKNDQSATVKEKCACFITTKLMTIGSSTKINVDLLQTILGLKKDLKQAIIDNLKIQFFLCTVIGKTGLIENFDTINEETLDEKLNILELLALRATIATPGIKQISNSEEFKDSFIKNVFNILNEKLSEFQDSHPELTELLQYNEIFMSVLGIILAIPTLGLICLSTGYRDTFFHCDAESYNNRITQSFINHGPAKTSLSSD